MVGVSGVARLVRPGSGEAVQSEYDVFATPHTVKQTENTQDVYYYPLTPLNSSTDVIEIHITASNEQYIDMSQIILEVTGKFTDLQDKTLADTVLFYPVNNLLHSLFKQIDVYLNDQQIGSGSQTYAYKAYIEKMLNYSKDTKDTSMTAALWYPDDMSKDIAHNEGGKKRFDLTTKSKRIEMQDRLHVDLFNSNRYMIAGVTVKLIFRRSAPAFYVKQNADASTVKFVIEKMSLRVRKVKPNANLLLAQALLLRDGHTAQYPITMTEIKMINCLAHTKRLDWDNMFFGRIPKRMVLFMCENAVMEGHPKKNSFAFNHYDVNFISLYLDGVQYPSRAYKPDFENDLFLTCYIDMLNFVDKWGNDKNNGISWADYKQSRVFFCFDFTDSKTGGNTNHFHLTRHGSVRLEMNFAKELADSLNVVIYSEFDQIVHIDSNRAVLVN